MLNPNFTPLFTFLKLLIIFGRNLFYPIFIILDFQYVILHKTWVRTVPNMLVLQFILGSTKIYWIIFLIHHNEKELRK